MPHLTTLRTMELTIATVRQLNDEAIAELLGNRKGNRSALATEYEGEMPDADTERHLARLDHEIGLLADEQYRRTLDPEDEVRQLAVDVAWAAYGEARAAFYEADAEKRALADDGRAGSVAHEHARHRTTHAYERQVGAYGCYETLAHAFGRTAGGHHRATE